MVLDTAANRGSDKSREQPSARRFASPEPQPKQRSFEPFLSVRSARILWRAEFDRAASECTDSRRVAYRASRIIVRALPARGLVPPPDEILRLFEALGELAVD